MAAKIFLPRRPKMLVYANFCSLKDAQLICNYNKRGRTILRAVEQVTLLRFLFGMHPY